VQLGGGDAEADQFHRMETTHGKSGVLHAVRPYGHGHAGFLQLGDRCHRTPHRSPPGPPFEQPLRLVTGKATTSTPSASRRAHPLPDIRAMLLAWLQVIEPAASAWTAGIRVAPPYRPASGPVQPPPAREFHRRVWLTDTEEPSPLAGW